MHKQQLIESLQLSPHVEGGYFRRTYCSPRTTADTPSRAYMSSIFYLLTDDSPTGHLHCNRSDIVHYYQGGGVLRYSLLHDDGRTEQVLMGPDLSAGQQWQLTVPGGTWKASELVSGEWALISEAVCPGFDFADMQLATLATLQKLQPQRWQQFRHLIRESRPFRHGQDDCDRPDPETP